MKGDSKRLDLNAMRDRFAVIGMAESFFQSNVLFALTKLRIFERIGDGDKPLDELAGELDARPETLARLLNAGVVLNLLETEDGSSYRVAPLARSSLLPSADEGYLGDWIRHQDFCNLVLSRLDQAVLTSAPTVDPATHLGNDPQRSRWFLLAMHDYGALYGGELPHYLDTSGCKSLLDLGCGPGTHAFYLGMKNPELELSLLDFPGALEVAREVQARYPLKNRVHYLPGDAAKDEIPGQYDVILVSNMLHQFGPVGAAALVKRLYQSAKPGGSLVVQARFLRDDRRGDKVAVFVDLLELCFTAAGRNHSVAETRGWLEAAGFSNLQYCPMSLFNENSFVRGYRM
jgi:SAM-dependent methyltransferase